VRPRPNSPPSFRATSRRSASASAVHPIARWLGCTHYEIIADLFRAALPAATPLIHQPGATADAIERYLERHKEYDRDLRVCGGS